MNYKVLITKEFYKDFKKISRIHQLQIKKKIEEISTHPERYKHLHYELSKSSRIRINKYRIIFSYDLKKEEIYLEKIIYDHKY